MPFKFRKPKQLTQNKIHAFWQDFDAGRRKREQFYPGYGRKVVAVSLTIFGTVRRFMRGDHLEKYLRLNKAIVGEIMAKKPKHFELHPVQVLAVNRTKRRLLERVYPNPNVFDFLRPKTVPASRYYPSFLKKLREKGIRLSDARQIVEEAYAEYLSIISDILSTRTDWHVDTAKHNVLVLDIDKAERKVLFALVDLGGSLKE